MYNNIKVLSMMVGGLPLRRAFARTSAKGGVLMQKVLLKEDTLFD